MFPQKNRGFQQQTPYPHHYNMNGYQNQPLKHSGGFFHRPRFESHQPYPNQLLNYYYPQQQPYQMQQYFHPQHQQKQSIFHDENGKIDFKKISGGIQGAMGIVNQVSPMMKTLSGFFIK